MASMRRVTAGEWTEFELPKNALERLAFLQEQVANIPVEHRESARFEDHYCEDMGASTELFYCRPASEQELERERELEAEESALKARMLSLHPGASVLSSARCGAMVAYPGGRTLLYDAAGLLRVELNPAVSPLQSMSEVRSE